MADLARARGFPRQGFSRRALLAALDDGTILVSDGRRLWQRRVNGRFGRLPSTGSVTAIAPLADGAFAVASEGGKATRVAAGHRRPLAPGWDVEGGLAGFGAGDAVTTNLRATEGQGPRADDCACRRERHAPAVERRRHPGGRRRSGRGRHALAAADLDDGGRRRKPSLRRKAKDPGGRTARQLASSDRDHADQLSQLRRRCGELLRQVAAASSHFGCGKGPHRRADPKQDRGRRGNTATVTTTRSRRL